jgi:hypothetical protein
LILGTASTIMPKIHNFISDRETEKEEESQEESPGSVLAEMATGTS